MDIGLNVIETQDRNHWLKVRTAGIGGSDIAAICGISPYRKRAEIWADKLGKNKKQKDNDAMIWGRTLEPVLADKFSKDHPEYEVIEVNGIITHPVHPFFMASVDRLYRSKDPKGEWGILEIKTTRSRRDWSDGVPDYVNVQVQWYLGVTGFNKAKVIVLISGQDYMEFDIEPDLGLIHHLQSEAETFWNDNVLAEVCPEFEGSKQELDLLKAMYPETDGTTVVLGPELSDVAQQLYEARQESKRLEKVIDACSVKLLSKMERATLGLAGDYDVKISSVKGRESFDKKSFKRDHPGMLDDYITEGEPSRRIYVDFKKEEE